MNLLLTISTWNTWGLSWWKLAVEFRWKICIKKRPWVYRSLKGTSTFSLNGSLCQFCKWENVRVDLWFYIICQLKFWKWNPDIIPGLWQRADLHGTIFVACDKLTAGLRHDLRLPQRFKTCCYDISLTYTPIVSHVVGLSYACRMRQKSYRVNRFVYIWVSDNFF